MNRVNSGKGCGHEDSDLSTHAHKTTRPYITLFSDPTVRPITSNKTNFCALAAVQSDLPGSYTVVSIRPALGGVRATLSDARTGGSELLAHLATVIFTAKY